MKIKLLKDIPGYKAGHVHDTKKNGEMGDHSNFHYSSLRALIEEGWAEEVDDIDIEEIRKQYNPYPMNRGVKPQDGYLLPKLTFEEMEWITAYRVVKEVIEKLNGDWKPVWDGEVNHKYEIYYSYPEKQFDSEYQKYNMYQQIPVCKDRKTVKQVISLCEPELKILFGVQ